MHRIRGCTWSIRMLLLSIVITVSLIRYLREVISLAFEKRSELVLHPIRFRIVQCLIGRESATTQDIAGILSDVPPASLYRHMNKLVQGGVLVVVQERRARGATEKTYALRDRAGDLTDEVAGMNREELMHTFSTFTASLVDDFARYITASDVDLVRDGLSFRKGIVHLSDEEFQSMMSGIRVLLDSAMKNAPNPNRHPRIISSIIVPIPSTRS